MSTKVSALTRGGVRRIMEMEAPAENTEEIYLQVTQIKLFEEKKKKNSIKQRVEIIKLFYIIFQVIFFLKGKQ